MCTTLHDFGLTIIIRAPLIVSFNPQAHIEQVLKDAWLKAGNATKAEHQIIMCIVPNLNTQIYGKIKRITDTVIGVPSQVIKSDNVMKHNKKQYFANVTLKLNVNMGGADVNYLAPAAKNSPSITASMDSQAIKKMLITFYKQSNENPAQIIFCRDGVSEGQFQAEFEEEVAAVKAACESLEKTYKPTLIFMVVQKRHHALFFPIQRENSDKNGNCLPGTIGTARSAKYIVPHDGNKFSADALQELAYSLCYVYGRSSCAVSVVPAAYYADIFARRGRLHSRGDDWSGAFTNTNDAETQKASYASVNPKLNNTMYCAVTNCTDDHTVGKLLNHYCYINFNA